MKKALVHSLLLAGMFTGLPNGSFAQNAEDRWSRDVAYQLDILTVAIRNEGYVRSTTTYADSINQGREQYMDLFLKQGVDYKMVAVCDQDCSDTDLILRDANGYLIDQDLEQDDTPIVSVTPKYDGNFRLWIKMVECSRGPCRWGVGIYIRQ